MSRLIFTQRVASNGSLVPPPPPPTARTAPAIVDPPMVASGGPDVAQAPASLTSSVALPPSARHTHRLARTPNMTSISYAPA
ncbi:hypothetical protein DVH24_039066 [Malus domestica]|uniref:Uncharacterized protein n=1 Tax=Malus domestica TaxID=3750 RepID=A0A498KGW1_MALDO|nr:hypothetical protein DVH24_039066 [Malus domestica]